MEKRWVFETIVEDDQDVVGLIGYALYKYKKYELAQSLRKQGCPEDQIQDQVQTFHDHFLLNNSVNDYRNKATNFLDNVYKKMEDGLKQAFDEKKDKLEKQYNKDLGKARRDFIKSVQEYERFNKTWPEKIWSFLISGIPGIVSSFIVTSLIIGAALLFVPQATRNQVFVTLASQYMGVDLSAVKGAHIKRTGDQ